ncbi:MAG: hypothetical protein GC179_00650 [Anaerolineaceae bacterium]|nr:hypothetical protein [Anaerolineaceae bacterium]
METLAKPKAKTSPSQLVWTTDYELVSPYSIEECISQLNTLREKYRFKRPPFFNLSGFNFDQMIDNGGIVYFGILAETGRLGINGKAIGQLIYQSENNTLIKVHIGLTKWSVTPYLITMGVLNIIFVLGYDPRIAVPGLLLFNAIFLAIQISNCTALKPELHQTICEALAIPKAPRPQTLPP